MGRYVLPLALASCGLICSIIGIGIVRSRSNSAPALALRIGMVGTPILFIAASYFLVGQIGVSSNIWWAVVFGSVGGVIIGLVTEYYTSHSYKPVREVAAATWPSSARALVRSRLEGLLHSPRTRPLGSRPDSRR